MNKEQFLRELHAALREAGIQDVEDIVRDYAEYFEMALLDGKSEQDIIAAIGSPRDIALEMQAENKAGEAAAESYAGAAGQRADQGAEQPWGKRNVNAPLGKIISDFVQEKLSVLKDTKKWSTIDKYRVDDQRNFPAAEINRLQFEVGSADITLAGTSEADVRIELEGTIKGMFGPASADSWEPVYELQNGTLRVYLSERGTITHTSLEFRVWLPAKLYESVSVSTISGDIKAHNFRVDTAQFTTTSGDIEGHALSGSRLTARSSSGDIELGHADANLHLHTSSGDIEVQGSNGFNIEANSASGDVEVSGQFSNLSLKSTSGDVELSLEQITGPVEIQTVSGDTEITLRQPSDFELNFSSISGELDIDHPFQFHSKRGVSVTGSAGAGTYPLSVKSVSGDFQLTLDK